MDNDHIKRPLVVRTPECDARYRAERGKHDEKVHDPFEERNAEASLQSFEHWFILENLYPYDAVTDVHHLLIPKRKFAKAAEMNAAERTALESIKEQLAPEYDCLIENFPRIQSVPSFYFFNQSIQSLSQNPS